MSACVAISLSRFQSTLPREERQHFHSLIRFLLYFNPRSHERSDDFILTGQHSFHYFNPRSHERSDLCGISTTAYLCDFNPRSHERSDALNICLISLLCISIHAPTRGATDSDSEKSLDVDEFQSTLPREERRYIIFIVYHLHYFNPRSHERSDKMRFFIAVNVDISIHAPTRGATCPKHKPI